MRLGILAGFAFAASWAAISSVDAAPAHYVSAPQAASTADSDTGKLGLRGSRDDSHESTEREATGGPRRLSALAGTDDQAWASAHSMQVITWRKAPARKAPPRPH